MHSLTYRNTSVRKILIITYYWPPAGGPGVQRWLKFSKYLPEFGYDPIIITVDPEKKRLVLSGREVEKEKKAAQRKERLAQFKAGDVVEGTVDNIKDYGAFVELEPGVDALLHVSQISKEHVDKPSDVLSVGQEIEAKVVDFNNEDHKISLSMKALEEEKKEEEEIHVEIPKAEEIGTSLGDLFKGLKLD